NGTASANVSAQLTPDGDGTAIEVHTDLSVTGKPAQFGRGVIQQSSAKLWGQCVGCLSDKLSPAPEPAEEYVATGPAADGARAPERESPASSAGSSTVGSSPVGSGPVGSSPVGSSPASSGSAGAELDLGSTVIPVLLRRYAAQIAGAVAAMLAVAWWRRRRKKRKA